MGRKVEKWEGCCAPFCGGRAGSPSNTMWPGPSPTSVGVFWPNGWMDQDETWHGGRPLPFPHCVRWRPSCPPQNGDTAAPTFRPMSLWPNGWMDQDAAWYGGRPGPRPHCVRCEPSSPLKKGHSSHFSTHVYCGQTAGWMKMPLGTNVGLVLDPPPPPKKGTAPIFRPMSIVDKRSPILATAEHLFVVFQQLTIFQLT